MKKVKTILCVILASLILLGAVPLVSNAADAITQLNDTSYIQTNFYSDKLPCFRHFENSSLQNKSNKNEILYLFI